MLNGQQQVQRDHFMVQSGWLLLEIKSELIIKRKAMNREVNKKKNE